MTTPEQRARHRVNRQLFNTIPIVLAGSMAVSLGLTGPINPVSPKRVEKPKTTPGELAKSIRTAFAAASRTAAASPAEDVSPAATSTASVTPTTYRVQAGDTVSSIAGKYALATASVLALNGLGWKSVIFPGQVLKLTNSGTAPISASPAVSTGITRYTITAGDTVGKIAARFGLNTETLLSANGLGWSSIIYPGQSLAIPATSSPASTSQSTVTETPVLAVTPVSSVTPISRSVPVVAQSTNYTVASGDTISAIAARFGISSQSLLAANGLTASSVIYSGRSLVVPGVAAIATTPTASTTALTAEMTTNARTIISVGRSLGVPDYGIVIALAAALQESGLRNLHYGDRDSLGLFQQRPSTGWGTASQVLDPTYATRLFFGGPKNPNAGNTKGLLDIAGWQSKSVTVAAQAVQRSGYPDAYAKWEATARAALAKLG